MDEAQIQARAGEIIAEFAQINDSVALYRHLISAGDTLSVVDDTLRCEDNRVPGCEYGMWIRARYDRRANRLWFEVDSDARITLGMVALILRVLNGQPPEVVVEADLGFLNDIGLRTHLSVRRRTGLDGMIHRIRRSAREVMDEADNLSATDERETR